MARLSARLGVTAMKAEDLWRQALVLTDSERAVLAELVSGLRSRCREITLSPSPRG